MRTVMSTYNNVCTTIARHTANAIARMCKCGLSLSLSRLLYAKTLGLKESGIYSLSVTLFQTFVADNVRLTWKCSFE